MIVDKALANCRFIRNLQGGNTDKGRVEHRSSLQLRFTHIERNRSDDSSLGISALR